MSTHKFITYQGSSGNKKLDNLANNFERGKIDTFEINSLDLGIVTSNYENNCPILTYIKVI